MECLEEDDDELRQAFAHLSPEEEVDEFINGYLSEAKLREMCDGRDLSTVSTIELRVDLRRTSLSGLSRSLPRVTTVVFNEGFIPCIREIGSGYEYLTSLRLSKCGLAELDGISSMGQLKEIYLPFNSIADISPLSFVENLTVLDLEGNCIEDIDQFEQLALCSFLEAVNVAGNPITNEEDAQRNTEEILRAFLPRIKSLNQPIQLKTITEDARPPSESRPSLNGRPQRSMSAKTSAARPNSGRPSSARQKDSMSRYIGNSNADSSSSFTHGTDQIMAGNPVLFLRSWKAKKDSAFSDLDESNNSNQSQQQAPFSSSDDRPQICNTPTPPVCPRPPSSGRPSTSSSLARPRRIVSRSSVTSTDSSKTRSSSSSSSPSLSLSSIN